MQNEDDSESEDSDDEGSVGSVDELIGEGGKEGNEIELALARAEVSHVEILFAQR